MKPELSFDETRVIGALIEKEITTPDQYPLSLNSLTSACNQKSNREPVVDYSEHDVQQILDELAKRRLLLNDEGTGSRVAKYKHRFCNTQFSDLQLSAQELAILCVMFLRGPQTPGELRTRTNRLCNFSDVSEVETVLSELSDKDGESFVVKLPREPGKRESRYAHLFSGDIDVSNAGVETPNRPTSSGSQQRIDTLEAEVRTLRKELDEIKQWISDFD